MRHGGEVADYHTFRGQPSIDRIVTQIVQGAIALRARSIIQFGILLLIATPIARVAFSLVGFAIERDRAYVTITAIVLAILLYSLISGAAQRLSHVAGQRNCASSSLNLFLRSLNSARSCFSSSSI